MDKAYLEKNPDLLKLARRECRKMYEQVRSRQGKSHSMTKTRTSNQASSGDKSRRVRK